MSSLPTGADNLSLQRLLEAAHTTQRQSWVPVGALEGVRIGDIWQDNLCIAEPGYEAELFEDVEISTDTASIIKAGFPEDDRYFLPLDIHPWHRLHTQSYCVKVQIAPGCQLVVPCMEIIRFYFGSSSGLLSRLFSLPFQAENLWQSKEFDEATGRLSLTLASGLYGASAMDIGRIANSAAAQRAAARIHSSCVEASAGGNPAYPICHFPFWGKTTLGAKGLWLPLGKKPNATFLAFQLTSCSHVFPFSSLRYRTDRSRFAKGGQAAGHRKGKSARSGKASRQSIADSDPGKSKSAVSKPWARRHQFPDLERKSVRPETVKAEASVGFAVKHADGSLELIAHGEPWGPDEVRAVDFTAGPVTKPIDQERLPKFVQDAIQAWVATKNTVSLVVLPGLTEAVFPLPTLVDEDGEVDMATLCVSPEGGHRPRLACVIEVTPLGLLTEYFGILEAPEHASDSEILKLPFPSLERMLDML